jgi:hypothetical protein
MNMLGVPKYTVNKYIVYIELSWAQRFHNKLPDNHNESLSAYTYLDNVIVILDVMVKSSAMNWNY